MSNNDAILFELGGALLTSRKPRFFSAYQSQSGTDFGFRAASVITGPIVFSMKTISALLEASAALLNGFANLFVVNFSAAKKDFLNAGKNLVLSALCLIGAILSPLINLIDLIGGAINSIKMAVQTPEVPTMRA